MDSCPLTVPLQSTSASKSAPPAAGKCWRFGYILLCRRALIWSITDRQNAFGSFSAAACQIWQVTRWRLAPVITRRGPPSEAVHVNGRRTQAFHSTTPASHKPQPTSPTPEPWPPRSARRTTAGLTRDAACTGASRLCRGQKCCLIMGTRPAEGKCPETQHAGLVICLIMFQLKTHVKMGTK